MARLRLDGQEGERSTRPTTHVGCEAGRGGGEGACHRGQAGRCGPGRWRATAAPYGCTFVREWGTTGSTGCSRSTWSGSTRHSPTRGSAGFDPARPPGAVACPPGRLSAREGRPQRRHAGGPTSGQTPHDRAAAERRGGQEGPDSGPGAPQRRPVDGGAGRRSSAVGSAGAAVGGRQPRQRDADGAARPAPGCAARSGLRGAEGRAEPAHLGLTGPTRRGAASPPGCPARGAGHGRPALAGQRPGLYAGEWAADRGEVGLARLEEPRERGGRARGPAARQPAHGRDAAAVRGRAPPGS